MDEVLVLEGKLSPGEEVKMRGFQDKEYESCCKKYEGIMVNTIRRFFPGGVATVKRGVLGFDDLMQESREALAETLGRFKKPEERTERQSKKKTAVKSYFIMILRSTLSMIYSQQPRKSRESMGKCPVCGLRGQGHLFFRCMNCGYENEPKEDSFKYPLSREARREGAFIEDLIPARENIYSEMTDDLFEELLDRVATRSRDLNVSDLNKRLIRQRIFSGMRAGESVKGIRERLVEGGFALRIKEIKDEIEVIRRRVYRYLYDNTKGTSLREYYLPRFRVLYGW